MNRTRSAAVALVLVSSSWGCGLPGKATPPAAVTSTRPRCLRIEYLHSFAQDGRGEAFSVERVIDEGDWAGPRGRVAVAEDLGLYRCEIVARSDGRRLFATGFCSIFGEWRTTDDASVRPGQAFLESVRVPRPEEPARFRLSKRNERNEFAPIFETDLPEPTSRPVRVRPDVVTIEENGSLEACVDIVFLGDGYTEPERGKFLADVQRLSNSLLSREPYSHLRHRFNVRAVFTASAESGVSHPSRGVEKKSALGCSYSTFGLPRYVLTLDDRAWRDAASEAPYDAAILLLNARDYGGGGIFQLYCVAAADSDAAEYLVAHEFGHSFAGLGDEYYTSPVAYRDFASKSVEPWEPNVTALLPGDSLKWRDRVDSATPLPTPWLKSEYDGLAESTRSLRENLERDSLPPPMIAARISESRASILASVFAAPRRVGAYEGALYEATGLYRPELDCIMFRRDCTYYCRVCDDSIRDRIQAWVEAP